MSNIKSLEEIYHSLVQNMGEGAGIVDAEEHFTFVNPAAEELFGVGPGELIGQRITDFLSPEQRAIVDQQTAERRQGRKSTYELEIVRPDGERRTVLVTASPLAEHPAAYIGALGIFRDISEQKRADTNLKKRVNELQLLNQIVQTLTQVTDLPEALGYVAREIAELLQASNCGIALLNEEQTGLRVVAQHRRRLDQPDATGVVIPLEGNQATQHVLSTLKPVMVLNAQSNPVIAPANEIMQRQFTQCLLIAPLLARGKVIGTIGVDLDNPNRQFTPDEIRLVETIAGQISGVIEMTRLYSEALQARQAAERANRTKSAFLANTSHELRTPLTVIIGYSEILLDMAAKNGLPYFVERLEKIHASGLHLLTLINSILDLSKIEAGRLEIKPEIFALDPILEEIVASIRPLVEKNRNRFELEISAAPGSTPDAAPGSISGAAPGSMYSDPLRIRQVMLNLLSNACKFTQDGQITLKVTETHIEERAWLHFAVIDTGIGISAEQMEYLFQPFSQAEESTARRYGGTGLGLVISKQLSEMMGGAIDVVSQPGRGSTFTLHLPREMRPGFSEIAPPPMTS